MKDIHQETNLVIKEIVLHPGPGHFAVIVSAFLKIRMIFSDIASISSQPEYGLKL